MFGNDLFLVFGDAVPNRNGDCTADQRGNDEYPYVLECIASGEESRTE